MDVLYSPGGCRGTAKADEQVAALKNLLEEKPTEYIDAVELTTATICARN